MKKQKEKSTMIKGRALDHIGLACTDVEAAKNWYVETLGFRVIGAFDCGKEQHGHTNAEDQRDRKAKRRYF